MERTLRDLWSGLMGRTDLHNLPAFFQPAPSQDNRGLLIVTFGMGIATGATLSLCLSGYLMLPDFEYHFRSFCNDHNLFAAFGTEVIEIKDSELLNSGDSDKLSPACIGTPVRACRYVVDVPCRVMPYLIDRNQHINNARYIYELNFTRRYTFQRLRIAKLVSEMGGNMVIQAQSIRYRREMKLWQKYFIRTSIIAWSDHERCFYVESRFLNADKTFILAIHHAKYKIVPTQAKLAIESETSSRKREIAEDLLPSRILAELGLIADESLKENVEENSYIALWEYANKVSSQSLNPTRR